MVGIPRPPGFFRATGTVDSTAIVDDAVGAVDVSNTLVYDMDNKAAVVGPDLVLIADSEASNINKEATLTAVMELAAGAVATSSLENADGVLKVDIANTTAATEPVTTNKVLVDVSGVNKAVTIQNLAKPIGEVFAGTNATSALSETDGVGKVNIGATTANTAPAVADLVLIEQGGVNYRSTITNLTKAVGEVAAGVNTGSALSETDGVMRVNVGGTTATTAPAAADLMLVEVGGVNKSASITNLAKAFGEVIAGTNATSALSETDGVTRVNIGGTDAATGPAPADKVLIDVGGVNKSTTITNLAKGIGEVMAGVAATSGITEVDGVLTVAAKIAHLEAALLKGVSTIPMSFETDEQTTTRIYFPMKVTINKIRGIVMKAITASDNGTITCGNSAGASTAGVVTATASDPLNTEYSVSPSTNNVVLADGYYYLTSAKSTAGGKVLVSLEWTRTA